MSESLGQIWHQLTELFAGLCLDCGEEVVLILEDHVDGGGQHALRGGGLANLDGLRLVRVRVGVRG